MKNLLLFPFGGNAKESLLSIMAINKIKPTWKVIGFLDHNKDLWNKQFYQIPVLGGPSLIKKYPKSFVLAVPGNSTTYLNRIQLIKSLYIPHSRSPIIIDPSSKIAPDSTIGQNTLVMSNVVISISVSVGKHCVILPNTVIAHNTKIGDYTLIGANVTISGFCTIEENCYIGSGSNIKEKTQVKKGSLIGLGSNVVKDIPSGVVAAGNPAKILRRI